MELILRQPLQPGVMAHLMDARHAALKIGLASSSDRAWVHGHLERLGVLEYFTTTKCYEDTGTHKPDPAPYLAVLEALEICPSEAVAFEDSPNGITAAKAAGIFCVVIPNPITRQLHLEHADYRLESFAALPLPLLISQLNRVGSLT